MLKNLDIRAPLAVSLGAIAGALSRYYAAHWLTQLAAMGSRFPIGTLAVNLSGCFLMGLVATLATLYLTLHPEWLLLATTGFLGSYTTFSTYELDIARLLDVEGWPAGALYGLGSPLLGLLCFSGGVAIAQQIQRSTGRAGD